MASDPFLTPRQWLTALGAGAIVALALGTFYIGMLWLGGG